MIFNKNVSYPYPVFHNDSNEYQNPNFEFEIDNITKENDKYIIEYRYLINSDFINNLIINDFADILFILNGTDSRYFKVKYNQNTITINSNRLDLNNKVNLQLQIVSNKNLSFNNCNDLVDFYDENKHEIEVEKYSLLGYSDYIRYQGTDREALKLFTYEVDGKQQEPYRVSIKDKQITLVFNNTSVVKIFASPMGISIIYDAFERALMKFILDFGGDNSEIFIDTIDYDDLSDLNQKLVDLMIDKNVVSISEDNIDNIIYKISNNMFDKFIKEIPNINKEKY